MTDAKRIRALVIDNEPLARAMIREIFAAGLLAQTAGECGNGREANRAIEALTPNLIFLDLELRELDGLDLIGSLNCENPPLLIFVTGFEGQSGPAFEGSALDHSLEPLDRKRFQKAWDRATHRIFDRASERREEKILGLLEELKGPPQYIERLVIKADSRIFLLDVEDIHYIQAEGNYVAVHNGQKDYLLRETITGLEARLDPKKFLRVHRSTIVKIDKICELQPWFHGEFRIILDGGKQLMLSRNYRARLQKAIGNAL
jgi:two-component system LytT family response regulator